MRLRARTHPALPLSVGLAATLAAAVAWPADLASSSPKDEAPTSDGDTKTWLRVEEWPPGRLMLSLAMRVSADGAETGFYLIVYPEKPAKPTAWRYRKHRKCCDDHAAPEDHLVEFEWSREARGLGINLSAVMFAESANTPKERSERELFVSIARPAADDCLAFRRYRGRKSNDGRRKE